MKTLAPLLIVLFVAGAWLGEGSEIVGAERQLHQHWPGLNLLVPVGLMAVAWLLAFVTVPRLSKSRRFAVGVLGVVALVGGVMAGEASETRAYNHCVATGETVRARLAQFAERNGRFPGSLGELDGPTPCRRVLRGTVLRYAPTESGYRLEFSDWLVSHVASESSPFFAVK